VPRQTQRRVKTPAGPFVWPPANRHESIGGADAAPDPHIEIKPTALPAPRSSPARWWAAVERTWLVPTALPVEERLAAAGWAPEPPGACCDRCATTVGPGEADEFGCASCRDRRVPWDRAVRLGPYDGELRRVILDVKFTRFRAAGGALGRMLARVIRDAGAPADELVIVPVPMSTPRRLARGIDHTAAVARGVAHELNAPLRRALRRAHRPSQRAVSMSNRATNVLGSIRLRTSVGASLAGRTVVIVDDVRTSGATLRAAAQAIRAAERHTRPDAIWAAPVSVTPGRGRADLAGLARIRPSG